MMLLALFLGLVCGLVALVCTPAPAVVRVRFGCVLASAVLVAALALVWLVDLPLLDKPSASGIPQLVEQANGMLFWSSIAIRGLLAGLRAASRTAPVFISCLALIGLVSSGCTLVLLRAMGNALGVMATP